MQQQRLVHAIESTSVADILERVLDKGIVIAGDIRIKLVDIELLTINIRLLVCSVDKAKEMGIDWWANTSFLSQTAAKREEERKLVEKEEKIAALQKRVEHLESSASGDPHNPAPRKPRGKI